MQGIGRCKIKWMLSLICDVGYFVMPLLLSKTSTSFAFHSFDVGVESCQVAKSRQVAVSAFWVVV